MESFEFDLRVCRLQAIKKAAYRYLGQYAVSIATTVDNHAVVEFTPLGSATADLLRFPNEVLDQELREVVSEETKAIRDLLLAQAFSGLSLLDPVGEDADFHQDPLGIAQPSQGMSHDAG